MLGLARTGVLVAGPSAVALVAAGSWLAGIEDLGWHTGWLRAAVILFAVSGVLGAAGGRRPRQARELAERLRAGDSAPSAELRALLDDRTSRLVNAASVITMTVVLWIMVAKP